MGFGETGFGEMGQDFRRNDYSEKRDSAKWGDTGVIEKAVTILPDTFIYTVNSRYNDPQRSKKNRSLY